MQDFINEIVKRERIICKQGEKIKRIRAGAKKHHRELLKENEEIRANLNKRIKELEEENVSLKIGLYHREEILQNLQNKVDGEASTYLMKAYVPMPEKEWEEIEKVFTEGEINRLS